MKTQEVDPANVRVPAVVPAVFIFRGASLGGYQNVIDPWTHPHASTRMSLVWATPLSPWLTPSLSARVPSGGRGRNVVYEANLFLPSPPFKGMSAAHSLDISSLTFLPSFAVGKRAKPGEWEGVGGVQALFVLNPLMLAEKWPIGCDCIDLRRSPVADLRFSVSYDMTITDRSRHRTLDGPVIIGFSTALWRR